MPCDVVFFAPSGGRGRATDQPREVLDVSRGRRKLWGARAPQRSPRDFLEYLSPQSGGVSVMGDDHQVTVVRDQSLVKALRDHHAKTLAERESFQAASETARVNLRCELFEKVARRDREQSSERCPSEWA